MNMKKLGLAAVAGLMILACSEGHKGYPWITDINQQVDAGGKMVGYEFFAKW